MTTPDDTPERMPEPAPTGADLEDRRVWERCSVRPGPVAPACLDAMSLAAWVDGLAPPADRDRIEAHLAECPSCLAAVRDLRSLLAGSGAATVSIDVVERARALVTPGRRLVDRRSAGRWGLAAAACLAACTLGYNAGLMSTDAGAADLAVAMSFGVVASDDLNDAGLALLVPLLQEATP